MDEVLENQDVLMTQNTAQIEVERLLTPLEREVGMWEVNERGLFGAKLFAPSFEEFLIRRYMEEGLAIYVSIAIEEELLVRKALRKRKYPDGMTFQQDLMRSLQSDCT